MNELNNIDSLQLKEWLDSIDNVIEYDSKETAAFLINKLADRVKDKTGVVVAKDVATDYVNSIAVDKQVKYPGDQRLEKKISAYIRWNAAVIVAKANKNPGELGGHISSYAGSAFLYEVGFNHFWHAPHDGKQGDVVFFQGHSSPGIYARSFVEGRFTKAKLENFRKEAFSDGLSSYPHPWLMPDYWQLPTVSMGLGPIMAIYQARFMHYLHDRGLADTLGRKVWCFIGDGESSEPETLGNIHIAGREKLDNLIYVISCNLQRLDGPVNGNGKIIQEMESLFTGANWKVIKVVWGSGWDKLLAKDNSGKLRQIMMATVDGEYQDYRSKDGKYIREKFFGKTEETLKLVADMSDDEIWRLTRGGHDLEKVYAAYYEAVNNNGGKPVVILAKTIKGYGLSGGGESQNTAHNTKKLSVDTLLKIRDKFTIPLSDSEVEKLPFITFDKGSEEEAYLHARRDQLGGKFPVRKPKHTKFQLPELSVFDALLKSTGDKEMSSTMAFVRILNSLLKDKSFGKHIVPIVPDEFRTFGMEGMFRQYGIWSHVGQLYTPEDASSLMYYKESVTGQILQEGLNEPGAMSSWIAAATSYANHGVTMIPFYVYYSMFGFQRIGDLAWAAGDMRARGFMIGGVAGRTTLNGEGLQHEDGHSHIQADLIPICESYDPTFHYELATIIRHGLDEMYIQNKDKFYYITVMNENYAHPDMPKDAETGIIAGCYLLKQNGTKAKTQVNLLGSGTILREVIAAADLLLKDFGINANIYSATSFNKLYRDGMSVNRHNMLHPEAKQQQQAYITKLLSDSKAKVTVAATDYIRSYVERIREFVPGKYVALGTDGFGRSDLRENLRKYFEVDRYHVVIAALKGLADVGAIDAKIVSTAIKKYKIDAERVNPWEA